MEEPSFRYNIVASLLVCPSDHDIERERGRDAENRVRDLQEENRRLAIDAFTRFLQSILGITLNEALEFARNERVRLGESEALNYTLGRVEELRSIIPHDASNGVRWRITIGYNQV